MNKMDYAQMVLACDKKSRTNTNAFMQFEDTLISCIGLGNGKSYINMESVNI